MRRIAILSDIHANLPALEAVWADVEREEISEVYHLGDLVGYNPYPAETVAFVREKQIPGLAGNYDLAVAGRDPDPVAAYLKKGISAVGRTAYDWTRKRVSDEDCEFLLGLPLRLDLEIEGLRLTLVHGSPQSIREYLYPDAPEEKLRGLLSPTGADLLLCGHTHKPMVRPVDGRLVVNPGSVGKPKDGDPRAGYLILNLEDGRVEPELRRVVYPVDKVAALIRRTDLPPAMADSLERGVSA